VNAQIQIMQNYADALNKAAAEVQKHHAERMDNTKNHK